MMIPTIKHWPLVLLAAFILLITQSCTVKEKVYFNEDFSGKRHISLDMSQMVMMMEMMGDLGGEENEDGAGKEQEDFKKGMMEGLNKAADSIEYSLVK